MEQHSDESSMLLYAAGDLEAFSPIFRRWKDPVFRYLYHLVRESAETVYQSTWLKVMERRAEYTENDRIKGWLFGIAHAQLMEHLKTRGLEKIMEIEETAVETSIHNLHELHFRSRFEQGLMEGVCALPAKLKEVFLLDEEGLTMEEIAEAICVSATVARSRLDQAHMILQRTLGAWGASMEVKSETWKVIREVDRNSLLDDQLLATSKVPRQPPQLVTLEPTQDAEPEKPKSESVWNLVKPRYAIVGLFMAIAIGTAYFAVYAVPQSVKHEIRQPTAAKPKAAPTPPRVADGVESPPALQNAVETPPPLLEPTPAMATPRAKFAAKAKRTPQVSEMDIEDDEPAEDNMNLVEAQPEVVQQPEMVWVRQPDNSYWKESIPQRSAPYFVGGAR